MSDKVKICRCEEVTLGEIMGAIRDGAVTMRDIKRATRAGMGLCQGRTCSRNVAAILARELGVSADKVAPPSARPPLRPIPVETVATGEPVDDVAASKHRGH